MFKLLFEKKKLLKYVIELDFIRVSKMRANSVHDYSKDRGDYIWLNKRQIKNVGVVRFYLFSIYCLKALSLRFYLSVLLLLTVFSSFAI